MDSVSPWTTSELTPSTPTSGSPGRAGMAEDGETRGGTFHGEIDRCRESHDWATACSNMPERDGEDQREDSPTQACSCWFARHSWLATSGASLYPRGVFICRRHFAFLSCYVCFVFSLFWFVSFSSFSLSLNPFSRPLVQSFNRFASKHQIQPEYGNEQADARRDCRTRLVRPNSQARTRTGEYSFSLFSWTRAGLATLTGWYILLLYVWPYIHTYIHRFS